MNKEEAQKVLEELYEVRPELLNDKAKRLFEAIMQIADERDKAYKIIDKMAEKIEKCKNEIDGLSEGNIDCFIPNEYSNIDDCIKKPTCKECIKEYFKKEV